MRLVFFRWPIRMGYFKNPHLSGALVFVPNHPSRSMILFIWLNANFSLRVRCVSLASAQGLSVAWDVIECDEWLSARGPIRGARLVAVGVDGWSGLRSHLWHDTLHCTVCCSMPLWS